MKRIFCLILAITLTLGAFPSNLVYAVETNKDIITKVHTDKETIEQGEKGIDYNISYIYIENQLGYTVDKDKFDLKNLDRVVKLVVNGVEEEPVDSKGNLKYTVEYNEVLRRLEIKVKENSSNLTHLKPFILRKHSHYNIYIPQGFFKGAKDSSDVINYNFTTKGDGEYEKDIIKSISPVNKETEVDYKNGQIILTFIDDIKLMKDAENRKKEYFKITSERMTDVAVDNFDKLVYENIDNYLINVEKNKLIFKKKTGKLDDFAKYKIEIKKDAVVLKNSENIRNIKPIYNEHLVIDFDTNNWVDWSYPKNNQGTIENERVERNPLIKIKFKYNVELIDKSKITLSSDGHFYSVDVNKDTWITYDGDILKIDINSLYRAGKAPLRANAAYKLTIGKGALRLKDYNIVGTETKMENEEMNLYFITGEGYTAEDKGLKPIKYTSDGNDDITNLSTTKLDKDGNIYIHFYSDKAFPRELKWNQWTAIFPVKTNEEALPYFRLYKSPQGYIKDHDEKGIVYDKEFRYDIEGKEVPKDGLDEIPLKSVEIVKAPNGNPMLKITPKYTLIPYNKYYIRLMARDILTDNYEKIMAAEEPLVSGKGQEIWTAPIKEEKRPQWEMDKISPEQIIEVEKGPKKTYTIHGAPKYNEYIDKENGKPIILYVDKEVVVAPKANISTGITLFEGYREGDRAPKVEKRDIRWYKLEYFFENGKKKTKISLYPKGELQPGRHYELEINELSNKESIFKSRDNQGLEPITLKFVIEGDGSLGTDRGIYKFEVTNKKQIVGTYDRPFLITDFIPGKENIKFNIKGYNFAEDIKQLRFVRETDNKTIIIPSSNLKFHDVTKITGTMDNEAKKEFAKITNDKECKKTYTSAGVYDIYIDFQRGNSTSTHKIEQRFIVKDRPKVIDTTPRDEESYFDPEILYEKFTNPDEEGYYIKVVFEDIGSTLKMKDSIGHGIQVNVIGDKTNLIDKNKQIIYKRELSTNKYSTNRFNVYIPLIDKLDDNQKYEVYIPENSIVEYPDIEIEQNRCYKWTFSTNYFPKAERLYEGSIPEYYDWNYPIVIDGSMFHEDTFVEFRDMNGKYYNPSSIDIRNNNSTMYIYLPRNRRLPVGVYDIIISNGNSYETQMVYGVFSVVEEGDYIPNEEYRVKDDSSTGMVKEIIGRSKDVLELSSRYTDNRYLEIDLDELMGSNTWVRSIEYPISYRDSLGELQLKSKWVNANISSLRLSNNYDERYIELRVGKVEPSMADILKKKLVGKNVKSNFIEVSGANFDFTNLTIEIPYFDSDGSRLRILRYDESNRRFEDIPYIIDLINGKVKGMSSKPGIFVIVE